MYFSYKKYNTYSVLNETDLELREVVSTAQLSHNLSKIIFKKVHFWVKKRHLVFGPRAFEGLS